MELRFFHMGLGTPFRDVNKLLKVLRQKLKLFTV